MRDSHGPEVENGKRYKQRVDGNNFYFTFTTETIMFHAPREGDLANQPEYTSINGFCRFSSKLRGFGMSWLQIWQQLDAASMGNPKVAAAIVAQAIQDKCL